MRSELKEWLQQNKELMSNEVNFVMAELLNKWTNKIANEEMDKYEIIPLEVFNGIEQLAQINGFDGSYYTEDPFLCAWFEEYLENENAKKIFMLAKSSVAEMCSIRAFQFGIKKKSDGEYEIAQMTEIQGIETYVKVGIDCDGLIYMHPLDEVFKAKTYSNIEDRNSYIVSKRYAKGVVDKKVADILDKMYDTDIVAYLYRETCVYDFIKYENGKISRVDWTIEYDTRKAEWGEEKIKEDLSHKWYKRD